MSENSDSVRSRLRTRSVVTTPMRATLDGDGVIVEVTEPWNAFARAHGGDVRRCGVGVSYLEVCDADADDPVTAATARAIRAALDRTLRAPRSFLLPCPGAGRSGWFELTVAGAPGPRPRATVTVRETTLVVSDHVDGVGGLNADFLRAARRRNELIAEELHRLAAQQLFAITLGVGSLAQPGAADGREAVALLDDLDRVIRRLLALSALLELSRSEPPPG